MATARELIMRHPQLTFVVLEKEDRLAVHQSGKNSGVIHAGIYYAPGSLKAKLCVEGLEKSYKYLDEHNIPYKRCGKLIVATIPEELPRLHALFERGQKNNVRDLKMVGPEEIREIEPNCIGLKALWSPHTGIVDWGEVNHSYSKDFRLRGGDVYLQFEVCGFHMVPESQRFTTFSQKQFPVRVTSGKQTVRCRYIVTCGGLYSDKLAELSGCRSEPKIVPFRGEYLLLTPEKSSLVQGNIYPVPDPRFPFLGVHFTPRIDGSVWLGPNAVLAFKREGYKPTDINLSDLCESLKYRGFQKLAIQHLGYGLKEIYRSINLKAQVKELQKFVPSLTVADVTRGPTGVRAQALDKNGNLVDDFVFDSGSGDLGERILHVRNAPSPGATSSLAIARMVADKVEQTFFL
ncbi:L-2-hydroxyglutarate dehydrogenase isoform X2 [Tachypleus tridentatus]